MAIADVVNENFTPDDDEDAVIDVLAEEQRVNPHLIRLRTGLRKQYVNDALGSLVDAGWAERVYVDGTRVRGLYDFVADPRREDTDG